MTRSALVQVWCQGCCWRPEHWEISGSAWPLVALEGLGVARELHCWLTSLILGVLSKEEANPSSFVSRASSFCLAFEIGICWVQEIVWMQRAFFSCIHPRKFFDCNGESCSSKWSYCLQGCSTHQRQKIATERNMSIVSFSCYLNVTLIL